MEEVTVEVFHHEEVWIGAIREGDIEYS
jgi:hypothetical protein